VSRPTSSPPTTSVPRPRRATTTSCSSAGREPRTSSPRRTSSGTAPAAATTGATPTTDRKSTRLNSSHVSSSYAVFCLKKKNDGIGPCRGVQDAAQYGRGLVKRKVADEHMRRRGKLVGMEVGGDDLTVRREPVGQCAG